MRRLVATVLAAVLLAAGTTPSHTVMCTAFWVRAGQCTQAQLNSLVVVQTSNSGGASRDATSTPPDQEAIDRARLAHLALLQELRDRCVAMAEDTEACPIVPEEPVAAEAADPTPMITLTDLAHFRPIVGELIVEPDGWGVIGTPTNFYATAETHTMSGELFDVPIQVRWTPTSYVFDYGDGTVEETEASGSAWNGPDQSWTETATSHAYASRDDVDASVTVVFTAEVDAGAGWFAVPGTLPVQAPAVPVKVFEVDTVLTNGDCAANPSAPGCG